LRGSGRTAARFRDQLGTASLRFALGALEREPSPLAVAGNIARVDYDRPMAGASLADMSLHGFSPPKPNFLSQTALLRLQPDPSSAISRSTSSRSPNPSGGRTDTPIKARTKD